MQLLHIIKFCMLELSFLFGGAWRACKLMLLKMVQPYDISFGGSLAIFFLPLT